VVETSIYKAEGNIWNDLNPRFRNLVEGLSGNKGIRDAERGKDGNGS
jgi:hypothetical protein